MKGVFDLFFSYNQIPLVNKPTRVTRCTATCIDHIITNDFINTDLQTGIIHTDVSDHFPVFVISSNCFVDCNSTTVTFKRKITREAIQNFKCKLLDIDWSLLYQFQETNDAYCYFLKIFKDLYDSSFPIQKTQTKLKTLNSPWMSTSILVSSKRKQKLYEKYLKKKTHKNEIKYKRYKSIFQSICFKAKQNYYRNLVKRYKNDQRKIWKVINEMIYSNKIQTQSRLPRNLLFNGKRISGEVDISANLNYYFANIGKELASKIPTENTYTFSDFLEKQLSEMSNEKLYDDELICAFQHLKSNKSCGHDDISATVVKECLNELFFPLKYIFNLSLTNGIFPDDLKIAKVTPIFKSGNTEEPGNYRPISVLPCFSKLLERIMYNRLYGYLKNHNFLFSKQFGFQPNHSTEHALIEFTQKILQSFDENHYSLSIFIDLSKAFDTVNHDILLEKLYLYGIRENNLKWFKSYLSNRKQFVPISNDRINLEKIYYGVPQGSILGPLLFLLYINDLHKSSNLLHFIIFADDTNISFSCKSIQHLYNIVNKELQKVYKWFSANKLSLNVRKTKYMLFSKNTVDLSLSQDIMIDSIKIERVNSIRFLGLTFKDNLSWEAHISSLETTLSKNLGIMYRIRNFLDKDCLSKLYFSLIHSHLTYGNIVWGSTLKSKLSKIHKKQKHALRLVNFMSHNTHSAPLFKKMNLLNIYQLNIYLTIILVFKIKNHMAPSIFSQYFIPIENKYMTRSTKFNFVQSKILSKLTSFKFSDRGPRLWNSLPNTLKSTDKLGKFKQVLKEIINLMGEDCFKFF